MQKITAVMGYTMCLKKLTENERIYKEYIHTYIILICKNLYLYIIQFPYDDESKI